MGIKDKLVAEAQEVAAKAKNAFAHKDETLAKAKQKIQEEEAALQAKLQGAKTKAAELLDKGTAKVGGPEGQ
jgi:hypothetical protein